MACPSSDGHVCLVLGAVPGLDGPRRSSGSVGARPQPRLPGRAPPLAGAAPCRRRTAPRFSRPRGERSSVTVGRLSGASDPERAAQESGPPGPAPARPRPDLRLRRPPPRARSRRGAGAQRPEAASPRAGIRPARPTLTPPPGPLPTGLGPLAFRSRRPGDPGRERIPEGRVRRGSAGGDYFPAPPRRDYFSPAEASAAGGAHGMAEARA
ncbi:proline-rich protein HaeIII subfamily 1-like [Dipodomys merriami]|uniref:proline-rich protein HaeIII subfamily 1-like n=1 Tax=Dipodomys merriami TaxID=94247 RepID=UPI003855B3FA